MPEKHRIRPRSVGSRRITGPILLPRRRSLSGRSSAKSPLRAYVPVNATRDQEQALGTPPNTLGPKARCPAFSRPIPTFSSRRVMRPSKTHSTSYTWSNRWSTRSKRRFQRFQATQICSRLLPSVRHHAAPSPGLVQDDGMPGSASFQPAPRKHRCSQAPSFSVPGFHTPFICSRPRRERDAANPIPPPYRHAAGIHNRPNPCIRGRRSGQTGTGS